MDRTRCRGIDNGQRREEIDELDRYLSLNEIVLDRCGGHFDPRAGDRHLRRPALFCGPRAFRTTSAARPVQYLRRDSTKVITGEKGDLYDRYYVRLIEMREGMHLETGVRDIPGGPSPGKKPPDQGPGGRSLLKVENPKELGYYIVADGSRRCRYHDGRHHQPDGSRRR